MSDPRSRAIHGSPIPAREYRAAPPAAGDRPTPSKARRPPSSRLGRRRGRPRILPLVLAGSVLFAAGFLLGRAGAEDGAPPADAPGLLPAGPEGPGPEGTAPGAPSSAGGEQTGGADWRLILVNWENPLPEGFAVPELTELRNGHAVDSRAYPDLQRMMDACRAEGLEPVICSSYRSWEKQAELFENKVRSCLDRAGSRREAEALAAQWVSRPGTGEHQAGLALDIVDKSYQLLDEGQEDTAVQKWLMAHCAEYGFILRYPAGKSALTGVGHEPWHYRYVGAEAAREIVRRGICLEEYLAGI